MQRRSMQLGDMQVVWTNANDGHLHHNPPNAEHNSRCCGPEASARRLKVHDRDWLYLSQVHGNDVVVVTDATSRSGTIADAAVTTEPNVTLGIATADCAPIALYGESTDGGIVAGIHAGWRGLQNGVIAQTVAVMRRLGAKDIRAALGPCIHVECNEFGAKDLQPLISLWGEAVRGETSWGTEAFNLPAAVDTACKVSDVELVYSDPTCTGCDDSYFSYRMRKDEDRQVMLVWRD